MALIVLAAADAFLIRKLLGIDLESRDPFDPMLNEGFRFARWTGSGIILPIVNILALDLIRRGSRDLRASPFLLASQIVGWSYVMSV